jgi:hypothetical protein
LDEKLVTRIDEVLRAKNIPRDSFVNRVLFFLLAKRDFLENLAIKYESRTKAVVNPLDGTRALLSDPFSHIRAGNSGLFYTHPIFPDHAIPLMAIPPEVPPNLFSLNVAISENDWQKMAINDDNLPMDIMTSTDTDLQPQPNESPKSTESPPKKNPSMSDIFAAGFRQNKADSNKAD